MFCSILAAADKRYHKTAVSLRQHSTFVAEVKLRPKRGHIWHLHEMPLSALKQFQKRALKAIEDGNVNFVARREEQGALRRYEKEI